MDSDTNPQTGADPLGKTNCVIPRECEQRLDDLHHALVFAQNFQPWKPHCDAHAGYLVPLRKHITGFYFVWVSALNTSLTRKCGALITFSSS